MHNNVGGIDRGLRILLGMAVIAAGIFYQSYWGVLGLALLLTGLASWCPVYPLLGLSTCRANPDPKQQD
jgi:hypothetical protein